jgi:hypothetical protein
MTPARRAAAAWQAAAAVPGRVRHGRPARITARAAVAAAAAITAAVIIPGTPAAPADITAAALWLAATARPELAPPPARKPNR